MKINSVAIGVCFCMMTMYSYGQINRNYIYREDSQEPTQTKSTYKKTKTPLQTFQVKGLEYGLNIGVYIPNNTTANYFNGRSETNNLERIIGKDPYIGSINGATYTYTYQEIKEAIGYDYHIKELPLNMKYDPGLLIGFGFKYNVNDKLGLFGDFNFTKLNTINQITIETENVPAGHISFDNLYYYYVKGTERRFDINAGLYHTLSAKQTRYTPYIQLSANFNNLLVDDAIVDIEGLQYSYINAYNKYYNLRDYGLGAGVHVGGGLRMIFKQELMLYTGFDICYKYIHLGEYKGMYLNGQIYTRFMLWKRIWKASEIAP